MVLMHFICYMPFDIYPWIVLLLYGADGEILKKYRISAIYQPAEQNLLHVGDIFKDTVDLRECPSENSLNGLFRVQPNYKTVKRM